MSMTAFEQNRQLHIDLGDGTIFTIPPIPGADGKEILGALVSVAFATDMQNAEQASIDMSVRALGLPTDDGKHNGLPGHEERRALYDSLRASEQERIAQAALLWNVQGGSIDAVHDLLNTEAGEAYPKALGRVMRSCGLGPQFAALHNWLNGVSASSTPPTGTTNTDAFGQKNATPLE